MKNGLLVSAILVLSLVASLLGACTASSDPSSNTSPSGMGKIQVYVTDAPSQNVTAIEIQASSIEAHLSSANESDWVTLVENPPVFDLMQVTGVNLLLGTANVTSGNYTQVRLGITSVTVTINGEKKSGTVPSDKLKLVGNFSVEAGLATSISLDFDAEKSIIVTGNGEVMLKPVIKLLVTKPGKALEAPIKAAPTATPTPGTPGNSNSQGKNK
jgi:hypothetical protein